MRTVIAVMLLAAAACGDTGEVTVPPPTTSPPAVVATGTVDGWCAVLADIDPSLALFAGAAVPNAAADEVRVATESLADAYDRLLGVVPPAIAADMTVVQRGFASFRDDLEVVGYEYERVFAAIGQRPWQDRSFTESNQEVARFAANQCGFLVSSAPAPVDDATRGLLVDAFVEAGLTPQQAACLADALAPDLAANRQQTAFEDAMAACGITFEDFVPDQ